jgi:tetratricopeptide (TPR) repeat protein
MLTLMAGSHPMHRFGFSPSSDQICKIGAAVCTLTLLLLIAPFNVDGQCQPVDPSQAKASQAISNSPRMPQFYDEPQFTVAGVADATNLGGHGSDTVVRTKESLAKDTASLSKPAAREMSAASSYDEKSLRHAVERDPRNFYANYQLGKLLGANGRAAEAVPFLERAAEISPGDYNNAYELAVVYANAGKYEESRASLRALIARADRAELHHLLGDVEEQMKHSLEAVREYQRAVELNPSEPYLFDWGAELLTHRAPEAAIEVFAKGSRLFPSSVRMLVGQGVAWHAHGSYDRAADCLYAASDLNPSDAAPYLFLAKMQNAGTIQSSAVVEKLARFARLHPENALANYYYASALWKAAKGQAEVETAKQVQSLVERAVHLDPTLGPAYLLRGVVDSDRGDWAEAISSYRQATEASPQLEEPHYRLAQAYRRVGEKAKAQRELQTYEQLSKKTSEEAERERHEIQQFVVALRDGKPASAQPEKP